MRCSAFLTNAMDSAAIRVALDSLSLPVRRIWTVCLTNSERIPACSTGERD
ncbi:MAG: hypothetical protein WD342_04305 [Verrucomicrobiales bacterium]